MISGITERVGTNYRLARHLAAGPKIPTAMMRAKTAVNPISHDENHGRED